MYELGAEGSTDMDRKKCVLIRVLTNQVDCMPLSEVGSGLFISRVFTACTLNVLCVVCISPYICILQQKPVKTSTIDTNWHSTTQNNSSALFNSL